MAEKTAIIKIKVQGTDEQKKSLRELQSEMDKLTKERKELNEAEKKGTKTAEEASKARADLNLKIRATRLNINALSRDMLGQTTFAEKLGGQFTKLGNTIKRSFVGLFAAQKAFAIVKDAINTITEYEQQMARVKAITGATDEEFKALVVSSKALGESTRFTANEVGKLQEELAKLGFTTDEILASQEAILQLAEATQSDLADSALVAASTLNAFGLEATSTQELVDVMAKSFTSSALDLEKFKTAMANVAPVAKEAGFSIQETTGFLGVLVDNGIEASKAGTGLRNVFLTLSASGLSLEEAMDLVNSSTDKAATATNLFGKENAVVATTIANNTDKIKELTSSLDDSYGAAEEMAQITGDTLAGDIDRLSSAWDGFILSLNEGDGAFSKVLRGAVQFITELLTEIEEVDKLEDARNANAVVLAKARAEESKKIEEILKNSKELGLTDEQQLNALKSREEVLSNVLKDEENILKTITAQNEKKIATSTDIDEIKRLKIQIENQQALVDSTKTRIQTLKEYNKEQEKINSGIKEESALTKLLSNIREADEEKLKSLSNAGVEAATKELERRKKEEADTKKANEQIVKDTEKLLKETQKLKDEALVLDIVNKRDAEDKKLEIEEKNALREIELSKATEQAKVDAKKAVNDKYESERKALERQRAQEDLDTLAELEKQADAFQAERLKDEVELEKEKAKQKREIREAEVQFIVDTANQLVDIFESRADREREIQLANLNTQVEQGTITQEEFEKKKLEIEKKAFEKKKKLELANIAISLAQEIASINAASAANPLNAVTFGAAGLTQSQILTGIAVARSAIQAGVVASQSFAEGGYTGDGFGTPDATGYKQAGVVHENEYVVPEKVLNSPRGSALVGQLENMRLSRPNPQLGLGFAGGGFTSPTNFDLDGLRNEIVDGVTRTIQSIQIVNNATNTAKVSNQVINIQSEATFG